MKDYEESENDEEDDKVFGLDFYSNAALISNKEKSYVVSLRKNESINELLNELLFDEIPS